MDDYNRIIDVLNSPFDLQIHKDTFTNYLEVIINDDGVIEYATPSHQEKLIQISMNKLHCTREELNSRCPQKYWLDFMAWLCKESRCIAVYLDHYEGVIRTVRQLNALNTLRTNKLYRGGSTSMQDSLNYIRYAQMQELNIPYYTLDDKSLFKVYCLGTMIEYNYTLRKASEEFLVPKSTLHTWIHRDMKHISIVMYDQLVAMMKRHKCKGR